MNKLIVLIAFAFSARAATYYVANSGNDAANGASASAPWQTIAHVNSQSFKPGDSILFQAGGVWREQLTTKNSWVGTPTNPIKFGSYGTGAMPIITGANVLSSWSTESYSTTNFATDPNIQAYWDFTDTAGTLYTDGTGHGNSVSVAAKTNVSDVPPGRSGASTLFTPSAIGTLAPTSISPSFPGHAAATNFTIGGWVKFSTLAPYSWFWSINDGANHGIAFMLDGYDGFYPIVCTGTGCAQTGGMGVVSLNAWHHIVLRVTSSTGLGETFVDGKKSGLNFAVPSGAMLPAASTAMKFGSGVGAQFYEWFGFNRSLGDSEIQSIYNNGLVSKSLAIYFTPSAADPLQTFRDSTRLSRSPAKSALISGEWWWDPFNLRTYVFDDPSEHTIEASQRSYAIYNSCSDDNITISGIQTQGSQFDGIYSCGGGVWTLSNGLTTNNYGQGVRLDAPASGTTVSYYAATYNGQDGLAFYSAPSLLVDHCITHDNVQVSGNLYGAGIKIEPGISSTNVVIQNSISYFNGVGQAGITGSGIWADTVGNGLTVRFNTSYSNNERGIDIDADNYALVYGNLVFGNLAVGIIAYADGNSSMAGHQIFNNTVFGNGIGILLEGPDAGSRTGGCEGNIVQNNIVLNSTTANLAAYFGCENPGGDGSGNIYIYNALGVASNKFIEWGNSLYFSSYAAWESAIGNCGSVGCSHSMQMNSDLTNPASSIFTLAKSSPARNAGTPIIGAPPPYDSPSPDLGYLPYTPE